MLGYRPAISPVDAGIPAKQTEECQKSCGRRRQVRNVSEGGGGCRSHCGSLLRQNQHLADFDVSWVPSNLCELTKRRAEKPHDRAGILVRPKSPGRPGGVNPWIGPLPVKGSSRKELTPQPPQGHSDSISAARSAGTGRPRVRRKRTMGVTTRRTEDRVVMRSRQRRRLGALLMGAPIRAPNN